MRRASRALVDATRLGARLSFDSNEPETLAAALKKMITDGVPVAEFHQQEHKIEEAFVERLKKVQGN